MIAAAGPAPQRPRWQFARAAGPLRLISTAAGEAEQPGSPGRDLLMVDDGSAGEMALLAPHRESIAQDVPRHTGTLLRASSSYAASVQAIQVMPHSA